MSRRFNAAWAVVVVMAIVLPVAIPYAVLPNSAEEACAKRVWTAVLTETAFARVAVPVDVSNARCSDTVPMEPLSGSVTIRGPYGLPIAEGHMRGSDISRPGVSGQRLLAAMAALGLGAAVVSLPFVAALLNFRVRAMHVEQA